MDSGSSLCFGRNDGFGSVVPALCHTNLSVSRRQYWRSSIVKTLQNCLCESPPSAGSKQSQASQPPVLQRKNAPALYRNTRTLPRFYDKKNRAVFFLNKNVYIEPKGYNDQNDDCAYFNGKNCRPFDWLWREKSRNNRWSLPVFHLRRRLSGRT